MTLLLYLLLCVSVPQLWALLLSRLFRRWDARKASSGQLRTPDYQI